MKYVRAAASFKCWTFSNQKRGVDWGNFTISPKSKYGVKTLRCNLSRSKDNDSEIWSVIRICHEK